MLNELSVFQIEIVPSDVPEAIVPSNKIAKQRTFPGSSNPGLKAFKVLSFKLEDKSSVIITMLCELTEVEEDSGGENEYWTEVGQATDGNVDLDKSKQNTTQQIRRF